MSLKIKNKKGDVEMDFCCESMDNQLTGGKFFVLDTIDNKSAVWLRTGTWGNMMDELRYCPYCGERFNITKDPTSDLLLKPDVPIRPRYWDDETDRL